MNAKVKRLDRKMEALLSRLEKHERRLTKTFGQITRDTSRSYLRTGVTEHKASGHGVVTARAIEVGERGNT